MKFINQSLRQANASYKEIFLHEDILLSLSAIIIRRSGNLMSKRRSKVSRGPANAMRWPKPYCAAREQYKWNWWCIKTGRIVKSEVTKFNWQCRWGQCIWNKRQHFLTKASSAFGEYLTWLEINAKLKVNIDSINRAIREGTNDARNVPEIS
jgi:hypothetical protein